MYSVSHLMGKGRGVGGNRGHDGPGYYPGKYASERGNPSNTFAKQHDPSWKAFNNPKPHSRDGIEAIVVNEKGETIRTIASEIVGSDSPRKDGFNYGSGWGSTDPLPPIYFEAVKLETAWTETAHVVQSIRWAVTEAIRNVRLAETETEKRLAVSALAEVVSKTLHHNPLIDCRLYVDLLTAFGQDCTGAERLHASYGHSICTSSQSET